MEGRFHSALLVALAAVVMLHAASAQTTHVVGDGMGWIVPPGGEAAYRTWAADKTFRVGDVLVFNFTTGAHDVAEVNRAAYDSCNGASPISMITDGPARINLTSAGEHHYICAFPRHCGLGQKLTINVSGASAPAAAPQGSMPAPAAAPQPSNSPPVAGDAPSPSRVARTHTVGDDLGWIVPPGGEAAYQTWARGQSFAVGDSLVFNFPSGRHDVLEVTKAEFDSCNVSTTTTRPMTTTPARVTLNSTGDHYYICAFPGHCSSGQKLAINVGSDGSTAPSPTSGGTTSPGTVPPPSPSSSSRSAMVAILPMTLLAVALSFLHY